MKRSLLSDLKAKTTPPSANPALFAVFSDGYLVDGNGMVDVIGR